MNKEEQKVLNKNDACYSYNYCCEHKGANVNLHEDIIIKSNDIFYIYMFAIDIKNSNKEKLFRKILELNDL